LERHGHDVTDEALIKRANTGLAPDGSSAGPAGNPTKPPYSSRFDSPEALREALNNTKPGSVAFQQKTCNGSTCIVTYTSVNGYLGKGVPKDGSTFVSMKKVKAIYQDMGNGNYQLLTMYPEI
jgi:hypothetical protein